MWKEDTPHPKLVISLRDFRTLGSRPCTRLFGKTPGSTPNFTQTTHAQMIKVDGVSVPLEVWDVLKSTRKTCERTVFGAIEAHMVGIISLSDNRMTHVRPQLATMMEFVNFVRQVIPTVHFQYIHRKWNKGGLGDRIFTHKSVKKPRKKNPLRSRSCQTSSHYRSS